MESNKEICSFIDGSLLLTSNVSLFCGPIYSYDYIVKIRFGMFWALSWEQRKLEGIATIQKGEQLSKKNMLVSGEYYVLNGGMTPSGFAGCFNALANTISISEGGNSCGFVTMNNVPFWSGAHNYTLVNLKLNAKFLFQYLKKNESQIMALRVGSGLPNIQKGPLSDFPILYPSPFEQVLLGSLFEKIDYLLTLHQRKCKTSVASVQAKTWEQRKLADVVGNTYGGGTPSTSNSSYWAGNIPWIQSSNLVEKNLFDVNIKKHISKEALTHSATQLVPNNSIAVVTHVGVGKLVFIPYSYTSSQDFISLSNLKCNPKFLCYALFLKLQKDLHIVQGSAIKGITKENLMNKQLAFPKLEEQAKIAKAIYNLDHLIALHQRKLKWLDNIRKRRYFYGSLR